MDIRRHFPISAIEDGFMISGTGDITFGYGLSLPEIFTLDDTVSRNLQSSFIGIFKTLPVGTVVHSANYYYADSFNAVFTGKESFTTRMNLKSYDRKPILRHESYLLFTVPTRRDGYNFSRIKDYVFKTPFRDLDEYSAKIGLLKENITNSISGLQDISAELLDNTQLERILYSYFSCEYGREVPENKILPPYDFGEKDFRVGRFSVALLSMVEEGGVLPLTKTHAPADISSVAPDGGFNINFSNPLGLVYPVSVGLPFDHMLNVFFEISDTDSVTGEMKKVSTALNLLSSIGHKGAKIKKEHIEQYTNWMADYGFTPCRTGINLIIPEPDRKLLNAKISFALSAFHRMNQSSAWTENAKALSLFFKSSPGNIRSNERKFYSFIDSTTAYLPKETHYRNDNTGYYLVDRMGAPCVLNLKNNPHTTNQNFVIFAPSGAGKSFTVNELVNQSLSMGDHVIIIDIGNSYKRICSDWNGYYFDTSKRENLSFNIFACEKDDSGNYLYRGEGEEEGESKLVFLYTLFLKIWKRNREAEEREAVVLKTLISQFYEYVNRNGYLPDFDLFYSFIDHFTANPDNAKFVRAVDWDDLKLIFSQYTNIEKGQYAYLLNGKSNRELSGEQFVVFELEGVQKDKDLSELVFLIIMDMASEKIARVKDRDKLIFIDEAIDTMKGNIGEYLGGQYRKIRKRGGRIGLATQGVSYLETVHPLVRSSIFGNSDIKILLSHRANTSDYPLLQKYLSITDSGLDLLKSLEINDVAGYREIFIQTGHLARVYRMQVSAEARLMYSTTKSETESLSAHHKKTGSWETAVLQELENRKK